MKVFPQVMAAEFATRSLPEKLVLKMPATETGAAFFEVLDIVESAVPRDRTLAEEMVPEAGIESAVASDRDPGMSDAGSAEVTMPEILPSPEVAAAPVQVSAGGQPNSGVADPAVNRRIDASPVVPDRGHKPTARPEMPPGLAVAMQKTALPSNVPAALPERPLDVTPANSEPPVRTKEPSSLSSLPAAAMAQRAADEGMRRSSTEGGRSSVGVLPKHLSGEPDQEVRPAPQDARDPGTHAVELRNGAKILPGAATLRTEPPAPGKATGRPDLTPHSEAAASANIGKGVVTPVVPAAPMPAEVAVGMPAPVARFIGPAKESERDGTERRPANAAQVSDSTGGMRPPETTAVPPPQPTVQAAMPSKEHRQSAIADAARNTITAPRVLTGPAAADVLIKAPKTVPVNGPLMVEAVGAVPADRGALPLTHGAEIATLSAREPVASLATDRSPGDPAAARTIVSQVAHSVSRGQAEGIVEIRLQPEELGRVRLTMLPSEAGVSVQISAERPDTLELLRRNIDMLAADLGERGFANLEFSFGADQSERDDDAAHRDEGETPREGDGPERLHVDLATQATRPLMGSLDIRL